MQFGICDPAMGSGHFLSGALSFLAESYLSMLSAESNFDVTTTKTEAKQSVLTNCIFGADINPRAVKLAKMSLWLETASSDRPLEHLDDQLACGDAVNTQDLNWEKAFQSVFSTRQGFDAVVMNPPYLGIKDNSHRIGYLRDLDEWKSIVTNKYDLFYFFIARGISILRPKGNLGCITTAYWPTADGASKLREFISGSAAPRQFVLLEEIKVFSAAQGQHNLISFFEKSSDVSGEINVLRVRPNVQDHKLSALTFEPIPAGNRPSEFSVEEFKSSMTLEHIRASNGAPWNISIESGSVGDDIIETMASTRTTISNFFDVHSGIETGADRVAPKHLDPKPEGLDRPVTEYKRQIEEANVKKGEGIFVISKSELRGLRLPKVEHEKYIKPFVKNGDLKTPFTFDKEPDQFLIYFANGDLDSGSRVFRHLERFKPILENRYKYRTEDRLQWFDLHRPLSRDLLESKKLISPYRALKPTFAYVEEPTFSSIDVFFTIPLKPESNIFLALGILNSELVWYWLKHKGKVKGKMLELYSKPLGDIPFKNSSYPRKAYEKITLEDARDFLDSNGTDQNTCALFIAALSFHAANRKYMPKDVKDTIDSLTLVFYGINAAAAAFIKADLEAPSVDDAEAEEPAA